jgi:hypothetical protein
MRFLAPIQGIMLSDAYTRSTDVIFDHIFVEKSIDRAFSNGISTDPLLVLRLGDIASSLSYGVFGTSTVIGLR